MNYISEIMKPDLSLEELFSKISSYYKILLYWKMVNFYFSNLSKFLIIDHSITLHNLYRLYLFKMDI